MYIFIFFFGNIHKIWKIIQIICVTKNSPSSNMSFFSSVIALFRYQTIDKIRNTYWKTYCRSIILFADKYDIFFRSSYCQFHRDFFPLYRFVIGLFFDQAEIHFLHNTVASSICSRSWSWSCQWRFLEVAVVGIDIVE